MCLFIYTNNRGQNMLYTNRPTYDILYVEKYQNKTYEMTKGTIDR